MAAATVTQTEYGYNVTGGTDATTIFSGKLWVKLIAFAGNADNATATLTTVPTDTSSTAVSCLKFKTQSNDLDVNPPVFFGDKGVPMNNLAVTLSNTSDVLYIYLRF